MVTIHRLGIAMSFTTTELRSDALPAVPVCCISHVLRCTFAAETQLPKRWLRGKGLVLKSIEFFNCVHSLMDEHENNFLPRSTTWRQKFSVDQLSIFVLNLCPIFACVARFSKELL